MRREDEVMKGDVDVVALAATRVRYLVFYGRRGAGRYPRAGGYAGEESGRYDASLRVTQ